MMSIRRDARYHITWRLELARCRLLQWNWLEISDIFRRIKEVEAGISNI